MFLARLRRDNVALASWFRRLSLPSKLHIVTVLIVILAVLAPLSLWFGVTTLSGLRAYVVGEGLWSKAQKGAVNHLVQYAYFFNEADYQAFEKEMHIPRGDRRARLELEKSDPDLDVVRRGFIEGGNNPDDIDRLIFVFRWFRDVAYMKEALRTWEEGDQGIERLGELGAEIHALVQTGGANPSPEARIEVLKKLTPLLAEVQMIDRELTILEDHFSRTLSAAASWLGELLLNVFLGFFFIFGVMAVLVMIFIGRTISDVDKAKNEFIALASHQLRTPLTVTRWYAEKLLRLEEGGTRQYQYADTIRRSNQRMIELVESLLQMSRVELGTFVLNTQNVDPVAVFRTVIAEYDFQIKHKKLELAETFPSHVDSMLIDPDALRIILQNLLGNAVRYTPTGGSIRVSVEAQKSSILFTVADTGQGIPESDQEKIFSRLYRTKKARSTAPGTGLGLYFVKLIVEQCKGHIWFDSMVNRGTAFYVTLPLNVTKVS